VTAASRRSVVVGGGIGGLATALALQQTGWEVRVLERSTSCDGGGAGLVLSPNAVRCLDALGVGDEVRSRARVLRRSCVRGPSGRLLARTELDVPGGSGPLLGIVRADLAAVLTAALRPGVLHLGTEVTAVAALEADLVVGADGLRSVVREAMGQTLRPTYRGYTVWRALVPAASLLDGSATLTETWGRGLRLGTVPVGSDRTYLYACASAPEGERHDDQSAELGQLRRRFGDWHDPVAGLLAAVEPGTLLRHDVHDLPPGQVALHRGRHVLVGDAGHAMEPNLGQGAGLALEDAVVLAHVLGAEPTYDAALARYARERAPRVAALARQSRRVGRLAQHTHPAVVHARDLSVRATPAALLRRATARATDWHPPSPVLTSTVPPTPEENR
jgi:2-polyprenyl-6-methoxyphenol hydroxylase-like FAD-dependent oxidoreductase